MGNTIEGKTYVKGSQRTIQPRIAENIQKYKSQQKVSSSSNIHHTHSQLSFTKTNRSEVAVAKRPPKKQIDDILVINEENYDDYLFVVKKVKTRNQVSLNMHWFLLLLPLSQNT